jgi:hypothetical protein
MRRSAFALAGVLLATGFAAGCGDDDDDKALSKAEYIKQGDAICQESGDRIDAGAEKTFANLDQNERPTVEQITPFVQDTLVPEVEKQLSGLRGLSAPEDDEDDLNDIYDGVEEAMQKVEDDPGLLLEEGKDPFEEPNTAAQAYGFKVCGEG